MTDRPTVKLVVLFLGIATLLFGTSTAVLVGIVIWLTRGTGTVDAAAVALVGLVAQPATGSLAGLTALLVSTRVTPDKGEIEEALAPLALPAAAGEPADDVDVAVVNADRAVVNAAT